MKQELKIEKTKDGMTYECNNMNAMDLICALKLCIESVRKTLNLPKEFYYKLIDLICKIEADPETGEITEIFKTIKRKEEE